MEKLIKIFRQFKNYLECLSLLIKDLYRFKNFALISIFIYSFVGTTLQATALGSIFFVLRKVQSNWHLKVNKLIPFIQMEVHLTIVLCCILGLFGCSIIVLYFAEKKAFSLSKDYANHLGPELLLSFPVTAVYKKNQTVHPKTGTSADLVKSIKGTTMIVEIAVRTLLRSPRPFLQLVYGTGFLLFLDPVFSLVLFFLVVPILIPLNKYTWQMKHAEKLRRQTSSTLKEDVEKILFEPPCSSLGVWKEFGLKKNQEIFNATGFAMSNNYRHIRVVNQAKARAVAGTILIVTGIGCLIYFGLIYGQQQLPVHKIVVYFGALRIASLSGRQVIARISSFARFYERINKLFNERNKYEASKIKNIQLDKLKVSGNDIEDPDHRRPAFLEKGVYSLVGEFPLIHANKFVLNSLFSHLRKKKQSEIIEGSMIISDRIDFIPDFSWRNYLALGMNSDEVWLMKKLSLCCRNLEPEYIIQNIDAPVSEYWRGKERSQKEILEIILIRAFFLAPPFLVIHEEVLRLLDEKEVDHWKGVFENVLFFFIYYTSRDRSVGIWGEFHALLVRNEADQPCHVATVSWVNQNMEDLGKILRSSSVVSSNGDNISDIYDDLDDDEDF